MHDAALVGAREVSGVRDRARRHPRRHIGNKTDCASLDPQRAAVVHISGGRAALRDAARGFFRANADRTEIARLPFSASTNLENFDMQTIAAIIAFVVILLFVGIALDAARRK